MTTAGASPQASRRFWPCPAAPANPLAGAKAALRRPVRPADRGPQLHKGLGKGSGVFGVDGGQCPRGHPERLPKKSPKREKRLEEKTVFILECQGRYALGRRGDKGLLAGLWEFPNLEGLLSPQQALERLEEWGLHPRNLQKIIHRKHVFTHIIWQMQGVYASVEEPREDFTWMAPEEIEEQAALPTAFRLFWEECDHV